MREYTDHTVHPTTIIKHRCALLPALACLAPPFGLCLVACGVHEQPRGCNQRGHGEPCGVGGAQHLHRSAREEEEDRIHRKRGAHPVMCSLAKLRPNQAERKDGEEGGPLLCGVDDPRVYEGDEGEGRDGE